jgi:hypothetical protein
MCRECLGISVRAEAIANEITRLLLHETLRDLELGNNEAAEVCSQFYEGLRAKRPVLARYASAQRRSTCTLLPSAQSQALQDLYLQIVRGSAQQDPADTSDPLLLLRAPCGRASEALLTQGHQVSPKALGRSLRRNI